MVKLIRDHYLLNRSATNGDTDILIAAIAQRLKCPVREFAAGAEVLTWFVPRHWKVRQAYLAKADGTRIVDFADNPLHLWTHSISFQGIISREQLEGHLFFHPEFPDRVPYHFMNGYRYCGEPSEWGFCLSRNQYDQLTDDDYYVHINTDLDNKGTMKVVDFHLPGENLQTIFFAAHTCHPGIVTDGLSDVAILVELFAQLANLKRRKYSYRLILGPEYFAAAAFLANTPKSEIDSLIGGVYLDMIGNRRNWAFSTSFQGNAMIDKVVANVVRYHTDEHVQLPHRKLGGNDEMFYNGPGFCIPTTEFGCSLHDEHHTDADNLELLDENQLVQALGITERIVNIFESDFVPRRLFKGPLYLSRYDLYMPLQVDEHLHDVQEGIQILMDGKLSCLELADKLSADFDYVHSFCSQLEKHNLIERVERDDQ